MLNNRSVPTNTMLAHVVYEDVGAAIEWLTRVFGFEEHYRYGDPAAPQGAQMHLGDAWFMLRASRPGEATPAQLGSTAQSLTVFVEDVDAHYERTRSQGVEITEELNETIYGERQYGVRDLGGHPWLFSTHAGDIAPEEWGAIVAGT
jgi:uncharacterized glyoxalase superfamily protein PhnB